MSFLCSPLFTQLISVIELGHMFKLLSNYAWKQVGVAFVKKKKKTKKQSNMCRVAYG